MRVFTNQSHTQAPHKRHVSIDKGKQIKSSLLLLMFFFFVCLVRSFAFPPAVLTLRRAASKQVETLTLQRELKEEQSTLADSGLA